MDKNVLKNRKVILAILTIVVLGLGAIALFTTQLPSDDGSHVSMLYETDVTTQVCHSDGTCEPIVDQGHNLVTNLGYNFTMCKLFGTTLPTCGGVPTVIAVGNLSSAETATLTTINTTVTSVIAPITDCGFTPAAGSITNQPASMGNTSISIVWTSTCTAYANTTALYNSTTMSGFGTSTIMFAGKNFASGVTMASGDQLNVTWFIWPTST